jgi:hypothetical protein
MNAAEKGERYARIFRKAGTFLANGNIARAVATFKEGVELADAQGDAKMAERLQAEIERAKKSPQSGETGEN